MNYQVFSSNEWMYPDANVFDKNRTQINLLAARGSFACCQLLLAGLKEGKLSFEYLPDSDQSTILAKPEVFRLVEVFVQKNTGPHGFTAVEGESAEAYTTRLAPFWVYDAMKPIVSRSEKLAGDEQNIGLYLSWPVSHDTKPGIYSGKFIFGIGEEYCEVPVRLEVSGAVVPEKATLGIIQWFSIANMAEFHGYKLWSEEHWDMIRQNGLLMRRARQTHFWITKEVLDVKENSDGTYSFGFDKAERLIRMYFDMGFTHIEGGMAIERLNYTDAEFVIRINDGWVKALSKEGYQYLHDYFTALQEFLGKNGWLDRLVQHVADEPHNDCAGEYRILAGIVRKLLPGVPLMDAVEIFGLDGCLDIWIPKNHYFENNREEFERLRRLGDRLWFYTCCHPGGGYMNRLLDFHLLRTRFLHWGNFIYGIEGYLHWGFNYYSYTSDPFKGEAGNIANLSESSLPPGDTHISYPGDGKPWGSVRLEMMRAGIEDYELLRIASEKNPEEANRIAAKCVRGFGDFTEDIGLFEGTYRELMEIASR